MPVLQRNDELIQAITDVIKETVDCEKIYLFGSYAYGEPHEDSDLDFYLHPGGASSLLRVIVIHT